MSERTARRASWSLAAVSGLLVTTGLVISLFALADSGDGVTFSHQFFTPLMTATYCVVGALVASRHPRNPIGWTFCATGLLSALNMLSAGYALYGELARPLPGAEFARWLSLWIWIPNVILPITFVLLLFPNGKLVSARWRPVAWAAGVGLVAVMVGVAFYPGPLEALGMAAANPYGISGGQAIMNVFLTAAAPLLAVAILGSIASVGVRYHRATGIERAQLRWMVIAGVIVIVGNVVGSGPWWVAGDTPLTREFSIVATDLTIMTVVIATGIAILHDRLWDIHILVNRTLVYGSLTALVIGLYVVIVGTLGMLLQTGGSGLVSLLGTGIIAILFEPLRVRLQRGVNRLMYGERDDPYAVLGRLSERLEVVAAARSVLPTIVETVAESLKLTYVAITLKEDDGFEIAAETGRAAKFGSEGRDDLEVLPLIYQLETVGQLWLARRTAGEPFSEKEWRLLETLARQAGVAAYNVRLTQELQRSRERLVTTREEERRRLRRDLHDGLGPVLASISFKLDAVHNVIDRDAGTARQLVAELKTQVQDALADIRRIAYDLRPPALDELGLVGALKAHILSHYQAQGLQITLEAPEDPPPLPAAVEVAAYRIVLEAMTNVSRHAGAHHCSVRLTLPDDLCLEVTDDGRGLPSAVRPGVGLTSMRERAEELGGNCRAETLPQGGTGVVARLPLSSASRTPAGGALWTPSAS